LHEPPHAGSLRGRHDAHVRFGELRRELPGQEDRLDTLHCALQNCSVRGIEVHCLDVRRLDGKLAARLQQRADGGRTIGELGENRLAHRTRYIRHKQHRCTVTNGNL
jgi:hypothetical protein